MKRGPRLPLLRRRSFPWVRAYVRDKLGRSVRAHNDNDLPWKWEHATRRACGMDELLFFERMLLEE